MMSETGEQFVTEKIDEEIHQFRRSSSSSSSDSDGEKSPPRSQVSWKKRLFGRKPSVHAVLGGGKSADIMLWRNKQLSGGILAGVTVIWLLFECIGYHLLTFVCHFLILLLAVSFLWSNATSFVNRSPPKLPKIVMNEELVLAISHTATFRLNELLEIFRRVAFGKDWKKFLQVSAALYLLSVVGGWFSFWTLFYLVFVMLYTAPLFYEKYEDQVDAAAEKAMIELNKQYQVFDEKVLKKIPKGPFDKKYK